MQDDDLIFAADDPTVPGSGVELAREDPWKILVVDDDEEVHSITTLVLKKFVYGGRGLEFFHAYNRSEACELMTQHPDMAVVFLDVVMETAQAGLEVVDFIRNDLGNSQVRIVLRTGQPGQAPEERIIVEYDINDYKEKTELSSQKLFTVLVASLRTYRHMQTIEANRAGLRHVIQASASLFETRSIKQLASGVLTQLMALLGMEADALVCQLSRQQVPGQLENMVVLAASGSFSPYLESSKLSELPRQAYEDLHYAAERQICLYFDDRYVGYFESEVGAGVLIYCETWQELDDLNKALVEIYCSNVHIAFENVLLNDEIDGTQKEIIFTLGEIAEARSQETGNHLKRVAAISEIIGRHVGLTTREVETLRLAAPMHDIGKVAVPDEILNAPGKLSPQDYATMKGHAEVGYEMLSTSGREIMKAAAIIAVQHHERYDGSGYPNGLSGENIHIYARIVSLADVYDALSHNRVYRQAYPPVEVNEIIRAGRGKHFDPQLVDIFFDHQEEIVKMVGGG